MTLKLYNTLSKKKETFKPLLSNQVRMYVCGMTVYDYCHLGHARVMVSFDMISRYLRFKGYDVKYIRNITDIDDKIIARAQQRQKPWQQLTEYFIEAMHQDEKRLQNHLPDQEPRASAHIEAIIDMIQALIDKSYAYVVEGGDVYFSIEKFSRYGELSNKKIEQLISGARIKIDGDKQDARDFVLWKLAKLGEPAWSSPWGEGRPGWHIECSAMSTCCLGNSFDIHGGGPDLVFPHHENEIAQAEAATGERYASYWMHAGAVRVDDEKMSKSLGNFFTIREILENHHPEVVRYFLLASHYRSSINYSAESLQEAKKALSRLYNSIKGFDDVQPLGQDALKKTKSFKCFQTAMDDDFNTPQALSVLFDLASQINMLSPHQQSSEEKQNVCIKVAEMKALAYILGLLQHPAQSFLRAQPASKTNQQNLSDEQIEKLIEQRTRAKATKDYTLADEIRDQLKECGIILEDSGTDVDWRRA